MDYISPVFPAQLGYLSTIDHTIPGVGPGYIWSLNLARLRYEKDVLENDLANCVVYLNALRKRQARNERLLDITPSPPRKKRKKIQQNKREVDKEIRNKEREERALLNNLHACETNIYIAERIAYIASDISSTVPDLTSSGTQYSYGESSPTEMSWNGYTGDSMISPFERHSLNPIFADDVAPDQETEESGVQEVVPKHARRPSPLISGIGEQESSRVPPNSAQVIHLDSTLSATAAVFEPVYSGSLEPDQPNGSSSTTTTGKTYRSKRRVSHTGVPRMFDGLSIDIKSDDDYDKAQTYRSPRMYDHDEFTSRYRKASQEYELTRRADACTVKAAR